MILFTILLITALLVTIALFAITGVIGGALLAVFGDIIVFALIVWAIIKLIKYIKKKR